MFIATPWIPAGRPNLNSERMIAQSGFSDIDRGKWTTRRPARIIQIADRRHDACSAITVPIAAPCVPNAGIGPAPESGRR